MGLGDQLSKLPILGAFLQPTSFEMVFQKDAPETADLPEKEADAPTLAPESDHLATEEDQAVEPVSWVEGESSPFFNSSYALDVFHRRVLTSPALPPPLDFRGVFADHRA